MQTLFEAISSFNVNAIQEFIELGLDLNQPCKKELYPLDVAMESILAYKAAVNPNAIATVKLLIQAGAKVDRALPHQSNWLHRIAKQFITAKVNLFFEDRDKVDKNDIDQKKQQARLNKNVKEQLLKQLAELFIQAKLPIDAQDEFGKTPLHHALYSGNQSLALLLIHAGASVTFTSAQCRAPLHIACSMHMLGVIKLLVEIGVEINALDAHAITPFECLSIPGGGDVDAIEKLDIAYVLLTQGATAKPVQLFHWLKAAFHFKHQQLLDYLWQQQVATLKQDDGLTALHLANTPELVTALMQHNAAQHINALYKPSGETPVLYIASTLFFNKSQLPDECIALLKLLQAYGADLRVYNKQGTLLHRAIFCPVQLFHFLLEQDVPINIQNQQGQTILHLAAQQGRLDLLELFLDVCDNQLTDTKGYTALEYLNDINIPIEQEAAQPYIKRLCAIMATLLNTYPSTQLPKNAFNLLSIAVKANSLTIVEALFQLGLKQIFNQTQAREAILDEVIALNHIDMLKWFIAQGLPINVPHVNGNTLLQQAVIHLKPQLINLLLQQGAQVMDIDNHGATLLILFAQKFINSYQAFQSAEEWFNDAEATFKLLITNREININQPDNRGETALDYLMDRYQAYTVRRVFIHRLLESGANLSSQQAHELIFLAASNQDWKLIEYLLQKYQVVKSNSLNLIARLAIDKGYHLIFKSLLAYGFNIDQRMPATADQPPLYPLEYAFYRAQSYQTDITKMDLLLCYLIKQGANFELLSNYYTSALHSAVTLNAIQTVTLLLSKRSMLALINTPADYDRSPMDDPTATPLQIAVKANNVAMVELLLKHGANPKLITKSGNTLLHLACAQGHLDMIHYLLDAGLITNTANAYQSNPLHYILCEDSLRPEQKHDLIKRFLAAGAEVNALHLNYAIKYKIGSESFALLLAKLNQAEVKSACLLHLAVYKGMMEFISQLISYDKDLVNSCDLLGQTPLYYAITLKDRQIYDYLLAQGAKPNPVDYTGKTLALQALYFETWQLYGGNLPQALNVTEFKKLRGYLLEQPEYKRLSEFQRMLTLGEHSYKLIMLFGNAETALAYIARFTPAEKQQGLLVPPIIHNLCLFNLPQQGNWDRATWAKWALLHGPSLTEYLGLAAAIERVLGQPPASFAAIQAAAKRVSYTLANSNPALADICLKHKIQEVVFNRVLTDYQPKKTDKLPDLYIDGEALHEPRFYLKKLAANDLRGLVLGALTHCCQSIGSAGEGCAMHGMQSEYGGFYAVFKKAKPKEAEKYQRLLSLAKQANSCDEFINRLSTGEQKTKYRELYRQLGTELNMLNDQQANDAEILNALCGYLQAAQVQASEDELIAQSWAWLSKTGNLVFDSWERLRPEDDRLCKPFLQAAARKAILQYGINKVLLGQNGQTPQNLAFEAIDEPEKPMDYWGYRDSLQQLMIANRESLSAENKSSSLQTIGLFSRAVVTQCLSYSLEEMEQLLSNYCKQSNCTVLPPTQAELLEQTLEHHKPSTQSPHIFIVPIQKSNQAWVSWVMVRDAQQQTLAYYLDAQAEYNHIPHIISHIFSLPYNQNFIKNQVVLETEPLKASAWLIANLANIQQGDGIEIGAFDMDKLLIEQQAVLNQPVANSSLAFIH